MTINFLNFEINFKNTLIHTLKPLFVNSLFCIGLIFLSSCRMHVMKESQLSKKNVAIGSYGGITGMNEKLIFINNGMIFKSETMPGGKAKISFVKQISKKEARQIFKTIGKIEFSNLKNDAPGNMNFFIERNRWLRKDKSYTWNTSLDSTNKDQKLILQLLKYQN